MRFLLDENVPFDLVEALIDRNHSVEHIAKIAPQENDVEVLSRAVGAGAILVTFDSDFGRLIFYERRAVPIGLVYLQSRPDGIARTLARMLEMIDTGEVELRGNFVVIDRDGGLRVVPLT